MPVDSLLQFDPGSFRDPAGGVATKDGHVYRYFSGRDATSFRALIDSGVLATLTSTAPLIDSRVIKREEQPDLYRATEGIELVLEHEPVPFISYSYEWPFEMLKAAAECQLEVTRRALEHEYLVKDATPFNVQFFGSRPVFIDVASLEPYEAGTTWRGYTQFCRSFMNPMLLQAHAGVPFQPWLRGSLEGIDVDQIRRLLPVRSKFRRSVFVDVVLQSWLEHRFGGSQRMIRATQTQRIPKASLIGLVDRLAKQVQNLKRRAERSMWSEYEESKSHYSPEDERLKEAFVSNGLERRSPRLTFDLGCNRGQYSLIASRFSDYVVAMDSDEASIGGLYSRLEGRTHNVLPLVVDLMNPSPGLGWAGKERKSLAERGAADFALALALVHHLAIAGNVPLRMIVDWLASIAPSGIVEFVPKDDPMTQRLLSTRRDVYSHYSREYFEAVLESRFHIVETAVLPDSGRVLYEYRRA